jgi:hypothetical protein
LATHLDGGSIATEVSKNKDGEWSKEGGVSDVDLQFTRQSAAAGGDDGKLKIATSWNQFSG